MPRYQYYCTKCDNYCVVNHLSNEKETTCPRCNAEESLTRQLTGFTTNKPRTSRRDIGRVTEEFIHDARHDLKQQKKGLSKKKQ